MFCFGIRGHSNPHASILNEYQTERWEKVGRFPFSYPPWILPSSKTSGGCSHPGPSIRWPIPEDRKSDVVLASMPTSAGKGLGISLNTTPSWVTVILCTQQQALTQSTGIHPHNAYSTHTHTSNSTVLLICLAHCTCSSLQDLAGKHLLFKSQRFALHNILGRQQLNW